MTSLWTRLGAFFCVLVVTACSTPRGAGLQSEIINEANAAEPTFAVEEVTRASIAKIADWPVTGWAGHYHWPRASRGPVSSTIQAGDRVTLTIWDSQVNSLITPEAQKSVKIENVAVGPSGTIFVPYVDEVKIRGMNEQEARSHIQRELEPIAPSAQVQLELLPGQGNSVDLVAGVASPGSYPLPNKNYSILSLIAQGGGLSTSLQHPIVRLIRGSRTYETPASALMANGDRNVVLRGGDKVVIAEDPRYFTALGATGEETIVNFDQERITALEALSMLGGINDTRADPQGVLVLREYPMESFQEGATGPSHEQVIFTLDLTSADGLFAARKFEINPGDTVMATESPIRAAQTILGLFGAALGTLNRVEKL